MEHFFVDLADAGIILAAGELFFIQLDVPGTSGTCVASAGYSGFVRYSRPRWNRAGGAWAQQTGDTLAFTTYMMPASGVELTSGTNPSVFGQSVTFTATVTGGTEGDLVSFDEGETHLATVSLAANGTATFTTSSLSAGSHEITATWNAMTSSVSQVVSKGDTTTTLVSSRNPSLVTQFVTLTATVTAVAPSQETPTGIVQFKDGTTDIGVAVPLVGGQASFTTAAFPLGDHAITAEYLGSTNFNASTSNVVDQVVKLDGTIIDFTSSSNPSTFSESVTFTATLTSVSGLETPAGAVSFYDGPTLLETRTLDGSGVASYTTSTLNAGTHSIKVEYAGDSFHEPASATVSQIVEKAPTTTTLASSPNPSVYGEPTTFTASVASAAGTPPGTITFMEGSTTLVTVPLVGGVASHTVPTFVTGPHSVTAVYSGAADYLPSTSSPLTQVVNRAATTTTLVSSSNPSAIGAAVSFTAHVSPVAPGAGKPSGNVKFVGGVSVLGIAPLDPSGNATITTGALGAGTHPVTATYEGDSRFSPSTSPTVDQTVSSSTATLALEASPNPSTFGQEVTFTATVTGPNGLPTGEVSFVDTSAGTTTPFATVALVGGVATAKTRALSVGSHNVTARFNGDAKYAPGPSGSVIQVVNKGTATLTIASSQNPSTAGETVTFTATLSSNVNDPTGEVQFFDGATLLGTGTLVSTTDPLVATATYATSALTVGEHTITATYGGDATHVATASPPLRQNVSAVPVTPQPPGAKPSPAPAPQPAAPGDSPDLVRIGPSGDDGCSCRTTGAPSNAVSVVVPLVGLGLLVARRRRRPQRRPCGSTRSTEAGSFHHAPPVHSTAGS